MRGRRKIGERKCVCDYACERERRDSENETVIERVREIERKRYILRLRETKISTLTIANLFNFY